MDDRLRKLLSMLSGGSAPNNDDRQFEPLAPLSTEEATEWARINNKVAQAQSIAKEAEAERMIFWTRIEKKTGIYDKNLRIDNSMVLIEVEKKNNCLSHGEAKPGFCDGNCDGCSLNPNKEEGL